MNLVSANKPGAGTEKQGNSNQVQCDTETRRTKQPSSYSTHQERNSPNHVSKKSRSCQKELSHQCALYKMWDFYVELDCRWLVLAEKTFKKFR